MEPGVARYYDRLLRWNRAARHVGYGGGADALTVHRRLEDPRAGGRATYTRLHDILLEHLLSCAAPHVLDAGCGLGGTMLALAQTLDATCVGVTLSAEQADVANAAAVARGVAPRVRAVVGSYDAPPAGPFDVVIAIESLAHSHDPAVSVSALAGVLAHGGLLIVVDDMPEATASADPDLARFKSGWGCPVLWDRGAYLAAFAREGLDVAADVDLTPACRPRDEGSIAALMAANRLARTVGSAAVKQVLDSHFGGLALERLLRRGHVRYRLLVARRPELQVS
jgi:SAM-dependent methyltransferase